MEYSYPSAGGISLSTGRKKFSGLSGYYRSGSGNPGSKRGIFYGAETV